MRTEFVPYDDDSRPPNVAPQDALALGHEFVFSVALRGVHGVVGDPNLYSAGEPEPLPYSVTVRAWSLKEAIAKLVDVPIYEFFTSPGERAAGVWQEEDSE